MSALSFLTAYGLIFKNPAASALIGWLVAMVSRQAGHFFFEPKGYDQVNHATHEHKEDIKVGYNLRRKIVLLTIWALSPALLWWSPTLFGIFPPHPDRATFIQHVGQIWLVVGFGALLFRTIETFKIFDIVYLLTEGGPGSSTETVSVYVCRLAFQFFRTSQASALGYIMVFAVIVLTSIYLYAIQSRRSEP